MDRTCRQRRDLPPAALVGNEPFVRWLLVIRENPRT